MTSQGTVKALTLDEFERELNDVGGSFSIKSKFAKLKDVLQKTETDVVKTEAKELKQQIDRSGKQVLSEEGNTFLKHLIQHGCLSQPMDPKSRSTNIHVERYAYKSTTDSLPGKKDKPMIDSVNLGSETIDDDLVERIKGNEELLKKIKDTDSERKSIEASLKLQMERLMNK